MRKGHGKSVVGKCSFLQCQYDLENRHKLILRTRAWNWLPNIRNLILWMTGTMRKLFMCYIKKNNNWGRAFFLNSKKNWSIVMITKSIWALKYFAFLSSFYDLHCHKTKPWDCISKTKQNKTTTTTKHERRASPRNLEALRIHLHTLASRNHELHLE